MDLLYNVKIHRGVTDMLGLLHLILQTFLIMISLTAIFRLIEIIFRKKDDKDRRYANNEGEKE